MSTNKAYRLKEFTGLQNLLLADEPMPKVEYNQVLIRVKAVSLNYRDLIIAKGQYPGAKTGIIPASDGAGEVVEVGSGVSSFQKGDRVMAVFSYNHTAGKYLPEYASSALGGAADGMLTQYRAIPAHGIVKIPEYMSYEQAATLPCAAVTAWNALYESGRTPLSPGQTVLLQGTGGVSMFGLQIAKAAGAMTIITSSSDEKLVLAKKLGATHTINYKTTPKWEEEVLKLTNGQGVDFTVEVGGGNTLLQSMTASKMGATIGLIGFVAQEGSGLNEGIIYQTIHKQIHTVGIYVGSRATFLDMVAAFDEAKIQPVVDKVFEFNQAQEAYKYLESQKHVGKVVIKVD